MPEVVDVHPAIEPRYRAGRARAEDQRARRFSSRYLQRRFASSLRRRLRRAYGWQHWVCSTHRASLQLFASLFPPALFSLSLSPSLPLSLSFSLSLLTRWLRRPCRTLNLSPRNSLILSTVPTSRLQGPFPTSAFSSFQLFSRGFCTHSYNDTFILDHARIVDDEIVADEQLSSMT